MPDSSIRRRLAGAAQIDAALDAGEPVRVVLLLRGAGTDAVRAAGRAQAAGASVLPTTENELRRLADTEGGTDVLAMAGPDPLASFGSALAGPGAGWLLVGVSFPGNVGFAIRTAEVSGAAAISIAPPLDGAARRAALRASMGAHRFLPVSWSDAESSIDAARAAGRRVLAVEDAPRATAPWDSDLTGGVLFVLGGERLGLGDALLARCDDALRLPMRGFIPAYNVHAAMAAVAAERLRQESAG